ncbi:exported hypothetical protein [Cupriavidus taiwanensis]|nr:exported hypothetical protein [Cupriavidus taiwanensis]SOZ22455.1 exported hypothetical protein [Cupriavidus taiwanensis]SOZ41992.1 exported hypothetical protein [Cupriavidus taiwanensis]SPA16234.1 exported hypothetical protein [Cupriavidus taiwanensis]
MRSACVQIFHAAMCGGAAAAKEWLAGTEWHTFRVTKGLSFPTRRCDHAARSPRSPL